MQKFSIFTVILTAVVVVVVAEFIMNEYLPQLRDSAPQEEDLVLTLPDSLDLSEVMETNVLDSGLTNRLGVDSSHDSTTDFQYEDNLVYEEFPPADEYVKPEIVEPESLPVYENSGTDFIDFEDDTFEFSSPNVYLREDQVKSAGFAQAYTVNEANDDFLFKTVYVGDLYDVDLNKIIVRDDNEIFVKVYTFSFGPNSGIDEVYEVLKIRSAAGVDIEINLTNDYGDGSFYMNDARRSQTAFLTVKLGHLIYCFSYPKQYHPQIENLVKLLNLEI